MLFHTHEFLALLVSTVIAFHWLPRARLEILLLASILFYAYAGLAITALFAVVVVFNYYCFRRVGPGRGAGFFVAALLVNLANLAFFKYAAFLLEIAFDLGAPVGAAQDWAARSILLPVGISFYTFELISLLVDARRGTVPAIRGLREYALFLTFFPHLIAGPILRGHELFPQLRAFPGPTGTQVAQGFACFGIGLVKKVAFADLLLAPRVDTLWANAGAWDAPSSWLLGILFGFQIYFDFAGYCDMAVGLGKFFGIELPMNFRTPYVSKTPSEFWTRWNITLSRWFGDYVYIPLGGSRVGISRTALNLLATMLLSGLWHGAGFTYLVWGGLHGAGLAGYHLLRRAAPGFAAAISGPGLASVLGWAVTTTLVIVGWVYFRAPSVEEANAVVRTMFGMGSGGARADLIANGALSALLLALHFAERAWWESSDRWVERAFEAWARLPGPAQAALAFPVLLITIGVTKKVQGAFIYFQF